MASTNYAKYSGLGGGGGGGAGTVTSVGLSDGSTTPIYSISGSPVTGAGTLTFTLGTQSPNLIFAGPTSGSAAQPSFRTFGLSDLPAIANNTVLGNTSGGSLVPSAQSLGTVTETTSSVLTLGSWAHATIGSPTITVTQATTSTSGYLSSTDWNTFNGKQASGSYLTALTGDGTATGPGSAAFTLATVNTNTGSWGSTTAIPVFTVNGKGLITAASTAVVVAPAGTLSGTTLAATVVTSSLTTVGTIGTGTWAGTTVAILHGGTGVTAVTIAPTATTFAGWDANKNLSSNNFIAAYTATATAGGTTALVIGSTETQVFTGTLTQTVTLPTTSVVAGMQFLIINKSTGVVTVQASGGGTIQAMGTGTMLQLTANAATPTTAAGWYWLYENTNSALPLANPMTTGGDVIYGGGSGVATRLANGTAGQVLTSAGGTSAPTWGAGITGSYYSGFFIPGLTWSTTSTTFADPTPSGSTTLTQRTGTITVTAAASNLPGITFTSASSTAVYHITAISTLYITVSANNAEAQLTDGTNIIATASAFVSSATTSCCTLSGLYVPGNTSANTVKIRLATPSASTPAELGLTTIANSIEWTVIRIA
jgi:hypothetical protein